MTNLHSTALYVLLSLSLVHYSRAESTDNTSEESISGIGGTGYQDPEAMIEELNIPEVVEIPDVPHTPETPEIPEIPEIGDFSGSSLGTNIVIPEPPE